MRNSLANELHKQMAVNKDIYFITCDLGYKLWDKIRDDYPDRFCNTGASEVSAVTMAVGLALSGKVPFVYSITPFLLYRAFEPIRYYLEHEQIPVKLLGGGRNQDYHIDGFSHDASDVSKLFTTLDLAFAGGDDDPIFDGIKDYWPETPEEIPALVAEIIKNKKPCFLSLVK